MANVRNAPSPTCTAAKTASVSRMTAWVWLTQSLLTSARLIFRIASTTTLMSTTQMSAKNASRRRIIGSALGGDAGGVSVMAGRVYASGSLAAGAVFTTVVRMLFLAVL